MDELEKLTHCKSLSEAAKIVFGIDYYNGRVKKELIEYCEKEYNIFIEDIVSKNKKHYCLNCGAEISRERKFCSKSCAASYNNKKRGKRSNETKSKISLSLIATNFEKLKCAGRRNDRLKRYEYLRVCENCGKDFYTSKKGQKFCSVKCAQNSDTTKEILRSKMLKRISEGTHSGWKSRNIKSYAEKFWEEVLIRNGVKFSREDFSTKRYFLDFLIEQNGKRVDLEIDGKQHDYSDRVESDEKRDKFLMENGYVIYRVKWNEINSDEGKSLMKKKISDFFNFLLKL